jgi:hypothetical protein
LRQKAREKRQRLGEKLTSHGVVERDVLSSLLARIVAATVIVCSSYNLDMVRNEVFQRQELVQLISGGDVVVAANDHAGEETTQGLSRC